MYLLSTDKTNGARILIFIYIKSIYLPKRHNTQVDIYFIFAMQLEIGINPVY